MWGHLHTLFILTLLLQQEVCFWNIEPLLNFLGTQVLCVSCFLNLSSFMCVCHFWYFCLTVFAFYLFQDYNVSTSGHTVHWSFCPASSPFTVQSDFFLVYYAFVSKSCFTNSPSVKDSFPPLVLTCLVLFSTFLLI